MKGRAFISHSSKDAEFAFRVVSILEAEGLGCWIAPRDIPSGSNYASEILTALQEAQVVALIFTENANGSPHVLREVERAISYRRPILPLKTASVAPAGAFNYFLATIHCPQMPAIEDAKAAAAYSTAVIEFGGGNRASQPAGPSRSFSKEAAFDTLWQMTTDMELRYRKACRDEAADEEWIGIDAIQVTINEFLISNRIHFPEELRKAAHAYSRSVVRLAKAAWKCADSQPAADFAITGLISGDLVDLGKELFEANREFERCTADFDAKFQTCRTPKGFWQRLFGKNSQNDRLKVEK